MNEQDEQARLQMQQQAGGVWPRWRATVSAPRMSKGVGLQQHQQPQQPLLFTFSKLLAWLVQG